jgi:hypothetical protein
MWSGNGIAGIFAAHYNASGGPTGNGYADMHRGLQHNPGPLRHC